MKILISIPELYWLLTEFAKAAYIPRKGLVSSMTKIPNKIQNSRTAQSYREVKKIEKSKIRSNFFPGRISRLYCIIPYEGHIREILSANLGSAMSNSVGAKYRIMINCFNDQKAP